MRANTFSDFILKDMKNSALYLWTSRDLDYGGWTGAIIMFLFTVCFSVEPLKCFVDYENFTLLSIDMERR